MFYVVVGNAGGEISLQTCVNRAQLGELLQSLPDGLEGVMSLLPSMANRVLVIEGRARAVRAVPWPRYQIVGD